ncbi:MAG: PorT family protein [Chitinophagaceae bacterium]|nr:PorT family protein [Chitinophagaceae bacterium]
MKSLVLLAFLSLCILPTLSSQNLNVGIKGGLNLYNIYNDNGAKYDNLTGFHVGLLGHIHLTRHLALQPEVVYSAQGAKYDFLGETVNVKLGYINVPLLLQYMFDNGFRMAVGPQIGFLLNAKD